MYKISISFMFILSFFLSGCTTHQVEPMMSMQAPMYVDQTSQPICNTTAAQPRHEGSIYGGGANPLFSDKKAMNVNDIVTVVIDESTVQSSNGVKNVSENSTHNLGGGVFSGGNGISGKVASSLNGLTNIGFDAGSTSSYSGSGTQTRNESFTTTISARVVKVLNNGNYFIDGSRSLLLNGTKQIIRITGVIRPYDIDQQNTINSMYIADAKIHYETEGDIKEATRRPWGSRMVESVWPF